LLNKVCELSLSIGILYADKYLDAGHHIQALTPWQRVETAKVNLNDFQLVTKANYLSMF